jgi:hypothetical protein
MEPLRKPRARPANAPRNGALARIHILKAECKLSEDEYRDLIQTLTNGRTRSAGDCDFTERERVAAHLATLKRALRIKGLRPERKALSGPQKKRCLRYGKRWNRRAWCTRTRSRACARSFNVTGLSALEFCDVQACSTLIESLKAWAKRSGVALKG